jgi:hypothetical protein
MTATDPDHLARLVCELHGYALDPAGAARSAAMASALAAALAAFSAESHFHEEPASFVRTLSALASEPS